MMLFLFPLALNNLSDWVKPEAPEVPLVNKADNCFVISEPLGMALIIGAWNYPVQLTLLPLVGAIAAGRLYIPLINLLDTLSQINTSCLTKAPLRFYHTPLIHVDALHSNNNAPKVILS